MKTDINPQAGFAHRRICVVGGVTSFFVGLLLMLIDFFIFPHIPSLDPDANATSPTKNDIEATAERDDFDPERRPTLIFK